MTGTVISTELRGNLFYEINNNEDNFIFESSSVKSHLRWLRGDLDYPVKRSCSLEGALAQPHSIKTLPALPSFWAQNEMHAVLMLLVSILQAAAVPSV